MEIVQLLFSDKYFPAVCALFGSIIGATIPTIAHYLTAKRAQQEETQRKILEMAYNAAICDINLKIKHLDSVGIGATIPPINSFLFHFIQSINVLIEKKKCSPDEIAEALKIVDKNTAAFIKVYIPEYKYEQECNICRDKP